MLFVFVGEVSLCSLGWTGTLSNTPAAVFLILSFQSQTSTSGLDSSMLPAIWFPIGGGTVARLQSSKIELRCFIHAAHRDLHAHLQPRSLLLFESSPAKMSAGAEKAPQEVFWDLPLHTQVLFALG